MSSHGAYPYHLQSPQRESHSIIVFPLLLLLIVVAYSNTLDASWHLDDYHNITHDRSLQLRELSPAAIFQTFFRSTADGQVLYRPVARLSFALNWYFGQSRVFGYHVVNLVLHWLTACLLFIICRSLLALPANGHDRPKAATGIAFLATLLWALNPIQTQAVTYIVQRMTIMAALFFLAAMWLYIKGRQAHRITAWAYFVGVAICFLLAVGSKENAVVLPLILLLTEIIFFQDLTSPTKRRRILVAGVIGISSFALLTTAAYLSLQKGNIGGFLAAYQERPFTLGQRLLTEPRIVATYLGQIFYPAPWRLSIEHDVVLSTSLWHPWTTLPAILLLGFLGTAGLILLKRRPFLSFAILFFLINHSVESTILPLELVFEHRNYLPSMFLFLPLVIGIRAFIRRRQKNRHYEHAFLCLAATLVIVATTGTYDRNKAWQSERTLWEDVLRKVPDSGRAYHNLAWGYYQKNRQYDQAIIYYRKALELSGGRSSRQVASTNFNMGLLLMQSGDFSSAAQYFSSAVQVQPDFYKALYFNAVVLSGSGRFVEAAALLDRLNAKLPGSVEVLNLTALNAMRRADFDEALKVLAATRQLGPNNWKTSYYTGAALSETGDVQHAARFLEQAHRQRPGEPLVWLQRIQNYYRQGDERAISGAIDQLCGNRPTKTVQKKVAELLRSPFAAPVDPDLIAALIQEYTGKRALNDPNK